MAGEIPYPQGPRIEQPNPFQTISTLQTMDQRQQAMAIQQQQNNAKIALGQLMQQHIDPATGELKAEDMMVHASMNPDIQPIMSEVMTMMLQNKHLNEQILGQKLLNAASRLDTNSGIASAIYDERMRKGRVGQGVGKEEATQVAADYIARQVASRSLEPGKEATSALLALKGAIEKGANIDDMLRTTALSAPKGLAGIEATGTTLKQLMEPVDTYGSDPNDPETYGQQIKVPRYQLQGALPPGAQNLIQQSPNTADRGSAPPAEAAVRQGQQPSVVPAASPRVGYLAAPPVMAKRELEFQEGKGDYAALGKEINESASGAASSQQAITETKGLLSDLENLGTSGTGPTAPMRKAAAKLLIDAENAFAGADPESKEGKALSKMRGALNTVSKVVTGSNDPKEWVGAAEAFEKLAAVTAIAGLRTAVGSGNKVTQQEVLKFMDLFPGLSSSSAGIKRMLNYMEKINATALDRQKYFNYWTDKHRTVRDKGYVASKFNEDWDDVLKNSGAIKFEGGEDGNVSP